MSTDHIDFIEPLRLAWRRMVIILFTPFDAGKWFALGFSAWLAMLGESSGSSFNSFSNLGDIGEAGNMAGAGEFIREHLATIIAITAIVVFVILVIALVVVWLNSRGKFMFLRNVAHNRAEIREPWRTYRRQGNSLFLWRLGFGLVGLVLTIAILGIGVVVSWPSIQAQTFGGAAIAGLVVTVMLFLVLAIVFGYITLFLVDFVAPLMYLNDIRTTEAWRLFLLLLKARPGTFVLYGLFIFVLSMAAGMAVMAFGFLTCCCGFFILALPYLGAVVLLPMTVFFRALSLEFLRQFGPSYDAFPPPPPAEPAGNGAVAI